MFLSEVVLYVSRQCIPKFGLGKSIENVLMSNRQVDRTRLFGQYNYAV